MSQIARLCCAAVALFLFAYPAQKALAQSAPASDTLDAAAPPGANYDKAEFRIWAPPGIAKLDGILVLVPGSNGDGRAEAADPTWRQWAEAHKLAIVATYFTDKVPSIVEAYADVSKGSGQALLNAINSFARRSHHRELAKAPLVFWGMSAGGEYNYEFAAWKPERVAAFVVNKGNFYYTATVSKAAQAVPALLFVGTADLPYRIDAVTGIFAMNRRPGALWALVQEPGVPHAVGRSADLSRIFFDDVLPMRIGAMKDGKLGALDPDKGWLGDQEKKTVTPVVPGEKLPDREVTSWLPTERTAKAWAAVENGTPFPP